MINKKLFYLSVLIFFVAFLFQSCGKISEILNNDGEEYHWLISADQYEVQVFETIILRIEDHSFSSSSYTADIGDKIIELTKISDQELSFMMPYVEGGIQYLNFHFEDYKYEIEFQVESFEVIENPRAVIDEHKQHLDQIYDSILYAQQEGILTISTQNLQTLASLKEDYEQKYTSATEDEKQELAQLMQSNPNIFDFSNINLQRFNDGLTLAKSDEEWEQKLQLDQEYITALIIATAATIVMFNGSLYSGNPFLIAAMTLALATEFLLIADQVETMTNRTYKAFDLALLDDKKSTVIEFDNNIPYQLGIDATPRTLYKNDQHSSSLIIELVANINIFTGYWNQVSNLVPGMEGSVSNLGDKNTYLTSNERRAVSPEYISIENISNSNVNLSEFTNTNIVNVTFSTYLEEDIDFTFDIVYKHTDYSEERINVQARLMADPCSDDFATPILGGIIDSYPEGQRGHAFEISFSDIGTGIMIDGDYYGACEPYINNCYPVIVEFRQWVYPNNDWMLAANSYSVELLSGDANNGVLKIYFDWFVDHEYRIVLRDQCGHYSTPLHFYYSN